MDAYLQSAAIAKDKSKAQQYKDLLLQSATNNPKLQDCILILGKTLGMSADNYNDVLNQLSDRDIIKYVSMPNSYGAGAVALTNYIYDNILENCSKYLASLLANDKVEPQAKYAKAITLFEALDEFNRKYGDSKADLLLMDQLGNSVTLSEIKNRIGSNTELQREFIRNYLPDIRANIGLSTVFKEGIVQHILDGAAHVI